MNGNNGLAIHLNNSIKPGGYIVVYYSYDIRDDRRFSCAGILDNIDINNNVIAINTIASNNRNETHIIPLDKVIEVVV